MVGEHILKVEYGYIVEAFTKDDADTLHYFVIVEKEFSTLSPDLSRTLMPLEQTPEELASLYGSPEDLEGRKVRILYTGNDFRGGIARIIPHSLEDVSDYLEIPSRGFRYAPPGRSS